MKRALITSILMFSLGPMAFAQHEPFGSSGGGVGFFNRNYPGSKYNILLHYSPPIGKRLNIETNTPIYLLHEDSMDRIKYSFMVGPNYFWVSEDDLQVYSGFIVGVNDFWSLEPIANVTLIGLRKMVFWNVAIHSALNYGYKPVLTLGLSFAFVNRDSPLTIPR